MLGSLLPSPTHWSVKVYKEKSVIYRIIKLVVFNTVNHGYSEHAYNELTLTTKCFSFPRDFIITC